MKQGVFIVIANPHLLPLGVPIALQGGGRKTACGVITAGEKQSQGHPLFFFFSNGDRFHAMKILNDAHKIGAYPTDIFIFSIALIFYN